MSDDKLNYSKSVVKRLAVQSLEKLHERIRELEDERYRLRKVLKYFRAKWIARFGQAWVVVEMADEALGGKA